MEHRIVNSGVETRRILSHANGKVGTTFRNQVLVYCSCDEILASDVVNGIKSDPRTMMAKHALEAEAAAAAALKEARRIEADTGDFTVVSFYQTSPDKKPVIGVWGPYTQARARKVRTAMLKDERPKEGAVFHVRVSKVVDYTIGRDI